MTMDKSLRFVDMCDGNLRVYENGSVFRIIGGAECVPTISNTSGYASVRLPDKNYLVHRLVATAFIPNPENKPQVNHKDGNKRNNSAENLEWATAEENMHHASISGLLGHSKIKVSPKKEIPIRLSKPEKTLIETLSELPADVQDRFLLMAQGAAVAVECTRAAEAAKKEAEADHDAE